MNRARGTYRTIALLVALTYFPFRVELFEREAREHAPCVPGQVSITSSSLSWETFDKNNAPQAFEFRVAITTGIVALLGRVSAQDHPFLQPLHRTRDKSPPVGVASAS